MAVKGRHNSAWRRFDSVAPDPESVRGLRADHPAVRDGRTLFPTMVADAFKNSDRVLISGHNSRKLGKSITRGPWAGMPIFGVSLEERATCPSACHHWRTCYGNAMPFARRHRPGYLLESKIVGEVAEKVGQHGRIAVRLHQLGDFYSLHYVHLWALLTFDFPGLHCFGFTAHAEDSEIGEAIRDLHWASGGRFYIRYSSNTSGPRRAVTIGRSAEYSKVPEGTVCPAQFGKTEGCGACGFCFDPKFDDRTVVFMLHGMKARGRAKPKEDVAMAGPIMTAENAALLPRMKKLAAQRWSAQQIATAMGLTRSRVLGLCRRNDIALAGTKPPGKPFGKNERERIKAMVDEGGVTAEEIGKAIDRTKGSVIAFCNRQGWKIKAKAKKPPPPSMEQRRLNAAVATPELTAEQIEARKEAERQRDSEARRLKAEAARGALRLHMVGSRTVHAHSSGRPYRVFHSDLGVGVCRFPLNDGGPFEFCGKPCGDATYCDAHQSLCYKAPGGDLAYMAKF